MRFALRLDPRFRAALYGAFALLVVTGAVWLVADQLKDSPEGELWQHVSATMLMVHGGVAMITLLLLGALFAVHVRLGWRSGRNRLTGPAMLAFNAVLIVTAFALYYSGSDTMRPWMSDVHIAVGFALPALFVVHVLLGRRNRPNGRES
jgi:cytochrome b561